MLTASRGTRTPAGSACLPVGTLRFPAALLHPWLPPGELLLRYEIAIVKVGEASALDGRSQHSFDTSEYGLILTYRESEGVAG